MFVEIGITLVYFAGMMFTFYAFYRIGYHNSENEFIDHKPALFTLNSLGWNKTNTILDRPLSTVFLEDTVKLELNRFISDFLANEDWYTSKFIPYKMGILMHGALGDGKTSLISALASEHNLDVYYVTMIGDVANQIKQIPTNRVNIVVLENLDLELTQLGDQYSYVFPKLLNMMDGLLSPKQIFVVTATSLSSIPEEFKRPGRFTHIIHIKPPTKELIASYFNWFYSNDNGMQFATFVADGVSMCMIQNHLLRYRTDPVGAIKNAKCIGL